MLSFLAKKDKNKNINLHKPKVPPKYWTFFARHITQMTEITTNNMSLFNNSSRQLRLITEQYLDVENVSEHFNHSAPVILAIKAKHIMVDMRSTQPLKTSDIFDTIHKRLS